MSERYRAPKFIAAATAVVLGGAGLAACTKSGEGSPTSAPSVASSASRKGGSEASDRPYPWPYCDNAPEHRPPAVGFSKDGPVVLVDSNCTDPSDPYTGVYDSRGPASQAEGIPRGRMRNGSEVVVLCWRVGQMITNDRGIGTTRWDQVIPAQGQEMLLPDGTQATTTGSETFVIPNTHLAFFDDPNVSACPKG